MQPGESFGLSAAELGAESLGDDGSAAPGCSPWTASALTARNCPEDHSETEFTHEFDR